VVPRVCICIMGSLRQHSSPDGHDGPSDYSG